MNLRSALQWIYTLLLRLYPPGFRDEFAEEMGAAFSDLLADAHLSRADALHCFLRELAGLPSSLFRQRWEAASRVALPESWTRPASPWQSAALAGLPHLIYALALYIQLAAANTLGRPLARLPEPVTFWLLVLAVLLVAWRLRFPVWSASWIGYALVFGLNQALPSHTSAWQAELIFLAWLGLTLLVLAWTARRDWLAGLLAVLPLAPMRAWWLGAEPPIILLGQALTFTSIGLMVCLAVIAMLRSGRWQTAVLLLLAVELAAGMPVPSAGLTPASPSITTNLGLLLLFTAPLWLLALWRQVRRQAG